MFKKRNLSVLTILMAGLLLAGVAIAAIVRDVQPDSSAYGLCRALQLECLPASL
jgi:hypothetical protein